MFYTIKMILLHSLPPTSTGSKRNWFIKKKKKNRPTSRLSFISSKWKHYKVQGPKPKQKHLKRSFVFLFFCFFYLELCFSTARCVSLIHRWRQTRVKEREKKKAGGKLCSTRTAFANSKLRHVFRFLTAVIQVLLTGTQFTALRRVVGWIFKLKLIFVRAYLS